MTRNHFRATGVAAVMLAAACLASARAEARQGVMNAAAAEAAKASPDLMKMVEKESGATAEQAAGAAGSLFSLAKSRLKPEEFAQIAKAVPGMDLLLKAAPGASAAAGGSGTDQLAQLAGSTSGIPAVASAFQKIGLKPAMVPKVASALTSFVTKSGGQNLGNLLAGVLK
jgi:hypothetical protein